eukprot:7316951-Prymnesium_polylepis.1
MCIRDRPFAGHADECNAVSHGAECSRPRGRGTMASTGDQCKAARVQLARCSWPAHGAPHGRRRSGTRRAQAPDQARARAGRGHAAGPVHRAGATGGRMHARAAEGGGLRLARRGRQCSCAGGAAPGAPRDAATRPRAVGARRRREAAARGLGRAREGDADG